MKIVYKEDYSIYNENMFVKKFKKLKFLGGPLDGLECEYEEFLSDYVEYSSNYIIGPSKDGIYRECEYKENVTIRFYLGDKMSENHTAENCEAKVDLSEREGRRKEHKISRQKLSHKSGLSQAKIYRIERNTSKRTTDEERKAYDEALDALIAEKTGAPVESAEPKAEEAEIVDSSTPQKSDGDTPVYTNEEDDNNEPMF